MAALYDLFRTPQPNDETKVRYHARSVVTGKMSTRDLIHDITQEYNMTTIINTHDMNSVLGIGEKVIYIYEGHKEWEGTKDDIFTSTNERLNNFIFASDLLRKVKDMEVQNMEG